MFKNTHVFVNVERYITEIEVVADWFPLFKLVFKLILCAHFIGILFYFIGLTQSLNENYDTSLNWLSQNDLLYEKWYIQYMYSLYWSLGVMVTIVYYLPQTVPEIIFLISIIMITTIVIGYSVTTIGMIMNDIDKKTIKYKLEMEIINRFVKKYNLKLSLKTKIQNYIYYVQEQEKQKNIEEENIVMNRVSKTLRNQIKEETEKNSILNFSYILDNFSEKTVKKVNQILQKKNYSSGEIIFEKNHFDDDKNLDNNIYLITQGSVELFYVQDLNLSYAKEDFTESNSIQSQNQYQIINEVLPEQKHTRIKIYKENQLFGIEEFFSGYSRQVSARSIESCTLKYIKRSQFYELVQKSWQDYEKFSLIKDQITHYGNSQQINIKCNLCKQMGHNQSQCQDIHFKPNKYEIIQNLKIGQPLRYQFPRKRLKQRIDMDDLLFAQENIEKTEEDLIEDIIFEAGIETDSEDNDSGSFDASITNSSDSMENQKKYKKIATNLKNQKKKNTSGSSENSSVTSNKSKSISDSNSDQIVQENFKNQETKFQNNQNLNQNQSSFQNNSLQKIQEEESPMKQSLNQSSSKKNRFSKYLEESQKQIYGSHGKIQSKQQNSSSNISNNNTPINQSKQKIKYENSSMEQSVRKKKTTLDLMDITKSPQNNKSNNFNNNNQGSQKIIQLRKASHEKKSSSRQSLKSVTNMLEPCTTKDGFKQRKILKRGGTLVVKGNQDNTQNNKNRRSLFQQIQTGISQDQGKYKNRNSYQFGSEFTNEIEGSKRCINRKSSYKQQTLNVLQQQLLINQQKQLELQEQLKIIKKQPSKQFQAKIIQEKKQDMTKQEPSLQEFNKQTSSVVQRRQNLMQSSSLLNIITNNLNNPALKQHRDSIFSQGNAYYDQFGNLIINQNQREGIDSFPNGIRFDNTWDYKNFEKVKCYKYYYPKYNLYTIVDQHWPQLQENLINSKTNRNNSSHENLQQTTNKKPKKSNFSKSNYQIDNTRNNSRRNTVKGNSQLILNISNILEDKNKLLKKQSVQF